MKESRITSKSRKKNSKYDILYFRQYQQDNNEFEYFLFRKVYHANLKAKLLLKAFLSSPYVFIFKARSFSPIQ